MRNNPTQDEKERQVAQRDEPSARQNGPAASDKSGRKNREGADKKQEEEAEDSRAMKMAQWRTVDSCSRHAPNYNKEDGDHAQADRQRHRGRVTV